MTPIEAVFANLVTPPPATEANYNRFELPLVVREQFFRR